MRTMRKHSPSAGAASSAGAGEGSAGVCVAVSWSSPSTASSSSAAAAAANGVLVMRMKFGDEHVRCKPGVLLDGFPRFFLAAARALAWADGMLCRAISVSVFVEHVRAKRTLKRGLRLFWARFSFAVTFSRHSCMSLGVDLRSHPVPALPPNVSAMVSGSLPRSIMLQVCWLSAAIIFRKSFFKPRSTRS